MTSATQEVLQAALALPSDEHKTLVEALSRSLEPASLSPEWHKEIARRLQKIKAGDAVRHDAEQHLHALRAKLG